MTLTLATSCRTCSHNIHTFTIITIAIIIITIIIIVIKGTLDILQATTTTNSSTRLKCWILVKWWVQTWQQMTSIKLPNLDVSYSSCDLWINAVPDVSLQYGITGVAYRTIKLVSMTDYYVAYGETLQWCSWLTMMTGVYFWAARVAGSRTATTS